LQLKEKKPLSSDTDLDLRSLNQLPCLTLLIEFNMSAGRVLIYGGKGALGSTIVAHFKAKNFVSNYYYYYQY